MQSLPLGGPAIVRSGSSVLRWDALPSRPRGRQCRRPPGRPSLQAVRVEAPRKPGVLQRLCRRGSLRRVEPEKICQETDKALVVRAHALPEGGPLGQVEDGAARLQCGEGAGLSRRFRQLVELLVRREVLRRVLPRCEHLVRERSDNAHHPRQEALYRVILEEHVASPKLCDDTTQRPYIHLLVVTRPTQAQDNFGCAVRTRLHVTRQVVTNKA
mmetsp:Transcript_110515/g.330637  ORF Transcript_110515/g.330637 Transcript_110515/m.330637 type:complete len:214 (+) Transcript_110515:169-810(+)